MPSQNTSALNLNLQESDSESKSEFIGKENSQYELKKEVVGEVGEVGESGDGGNVEETYKDVGVDGGSKSTNDISDINNQIGEESNESDSGNGNHGIHTPVTHIINSNPFAVPDSIAQNLPNEILVCVFSYLSPGCLDAASLVCRKWYEAASDASWRASFLRHFYSSKFNRVTSSLKWRTELMSRLDYLHKWKKGHCNNLSFNGLIWDISHIFCDFEASRIIAFSIWRGVGTIADPTRGKVANQRVFTSKALQTTSNTVSVDGSRFGLIYGFDSGKVQIVLFTHETRLRDYITMKGTHFGPVSCVWINKLESPRSTNKIAALSGGDDGHVYQWELNGCTLLKDFSICPEVIEHEEVDESGSGGGSGDGNVNENSNSNSNSNLNLNSQPKISKSRRIIHILSDSKDKIVCINNFGEVFASFSGKEFIKIGEFIHPIVEETAATSISYFDVDFTSNYVVFAHGQHFMRFKLTENPAKFESIHFSLSGMNSQSYIVAASMDHTTFPQSDLVTDTPGFNFRYLAAATSDNLVFIWLLQDDINEKGMISPLRKSDSPFQLAEQTLINGLPHIPNTRPTITAIALNSMVLLLGSYNGVTVSLDLLTGEFLRVVSARFSKRALNLRATEDPDSISLWPITQLEIDPDPSNPHGIIVVRSAIQYFDLGVDNKKSSIKKKGVKKRNRIPYDGQPSRARLTEKIEMDLELMDFDDEELNEVRERRDRDRENLEGYIPEDLSEEDQLKYAMMLSEEAAKNESMKLEEEDEDIRRAISLSMNAGESEPSGSHPIHEEVYEEESFDHPLNESDLDESLRLAIELSKAEAHNNNGQVHHSDEDSLYQRPTYISRPIASPPSYDEEDMDEELRLAIELSKADSAYNSDSQLYDKPDETDLELAIRLSLQAENNQQTSKHKN